ncbi:MAG TPA: flagellar biosynthesis protein FliQ [Gemmatimonadales bacterium]|nr:flagellar biosynthesis protein FliQ [Gemmatimonadales bacterium]
MTATLALELTRRAVTLCLLVGAPMLLTALAVGVLVSIVQAATQIQEQTLTFIPKLLAVALVLVLALPWMLRTLVEFLAAALRGLPGVVG